jgi:hypothetical protein
MTRNCPPAPVLTTAAPQGRGQRLAVQHHAARRASEHAEVADQRCDDARLLASLLGLAPTPDVLAVLCDGLTGAYVAGWTDRDADDRMPLLAGLGATR